MLLQELVKLSSSESDPAWIDVKTMWNDGDPSGWDWINNGKEFLWLSEKMAGDIFIK